MPVSPDSIVRTVMDRGPAVIAVFLRNRMHCPGCAMSSFMTVAEAAENYQLDSGELVEELRAALAAPVSERDR